MTGPGDALTYTERGGEATRRVLIELAHVLGAYRDRLVVIGGIVPTLLIDAPDTPHVGTLDIDLTLDAHGLREDQEYARIITLLEAQHYVRSGQDGGADLRAFQLQRTVDLADGGPVIPVVIDLLMPRGLKLKKNRPPVTPGLRVQEIDGGALALRHTVTHVLSGRTPDNWENSAQLRVVSLPAFLALKGDALKNRVKQKDAYDVYYVIRNSAHGPAALAEECRPLLSDPFAAAAYQEIAEKFRSAAAYGPGTVGTFLQGRLPPGLTEQQLRTDAFRQVAAWAKALGLPPQLWSGPDDR